MRYRKHLYRSVFTFSVILFLLMSVKDWVEQGDPGLGLVVGMYFAIGLVLATKRVGNVNNPLISLLVMLYAWTAIMNAMAVIYLYFEKTMWKQRVGYYLEAELATAIAIIMVPWMLGMVLLLAVNTKSLRCLFTNQ